MPNLLLIPTLMECSIVEPVVQQAIEQKFDLPGGRASWRIERCGFGLVAAAANTARLIEQHRPDRIILLGIAGGFHQTVAVGDAATFDLVTCHGIGVGDSLSIHHRSADELGWKHCDGNETRASVGDTIWLTRRWGTASNHTKHHLISVTSGSANEHEAHLRRTRFADAVAEDMEGFAVAFACESAGTPLEIVRGISNLAGDRNHEQWQVRSALLAAAAKAIELINQ